MRSQWVAWIALLVAIGCMREAGAADGTPQGRAPRSTSATGVAHVDPLLATVDEAISITKRRELDGRAHTPWQVMHGILGLRQDFMVRVDGERMSGLEWISRRGATYKGELYFEKTEHGGRGHPFTKAMIFEGHPRQFLAYLTLSRVGMDYSLKAGDETITVADIVRSAQQEVRSGEEPGWTLWGLSHYLDSDAAWKNQNGEDWSIERLVRSQTYEPVTSAACGGTHGLFALTWARNRRLESGQPLSGVWLEADQKIRRYLEEARTNQSADGSFSVDFFKGKRAGRDAQERIGPSGHTLEFVILALPQERLREPWVRNGVYSVARDLIETRKQSVSVAPLYHAVDGLVLYKERMAPRPAAAKEAVAGSQDAAPPPASTQTTTMPDAAP